MCKKLHTGCIFGAVPPVSFHPELELICDPMFASMVGSLLACGTLAAIVQVFITDWLAQSVSWMPFVTQTTVWMTAPVLVVGAVLLSVVASAVSLRRYLKT